MAIKQHGRRAAASKVKTPLTELTEILNANSGVYGRRAAVVVASGGLLTAAIMPAAGADAGDSVSVSQEATAQVQYENQSATVIAAPAADKKDAKKDSSSFGVDVENVTAAPAPKPSPTSTPSASSNDGNGSSNDNGTSGDSDKGNSGKSDKGSGSSAGPIDGSKAQQVIGWAKRGVGTPYVMGGTTQSGWDCSGFTSWVYSHVGVNLPRTSGAQRSAGQVVSRSEARAGDLVWHPGHVGVYAGNGMMYDAGSPSSGTSYRSIGWMGNVTFIRVL